MEAVNTYKPYKKLTYLKEEREGEPWWQFAKESMGIRNFSFVAIRVYAVLFSDA